MKSYCPQFNKKCNKIVFKKILKSQDHHGAINASQVRKRAKLPLFANLLVPAVVRVGSRTARCVRRVRWWSKGTRTSLNDRRWWYWRVLESRIRHPRMHESHISLKTRIKKSQISVIQKYSPVIIRSFDFLSHYFLPCTMWRPWYIGSG